MDIIRKIHTVVGGILKAAGFLLAVAVPVTMLIQVLLRYVFKAPLLGIEEFLQFPTVWLYMIGAALASVMHSHIECGVLAVYIKNEKALSVLNAVKCLISAVVGCWLTYWCWWYLLYSLDKWKISDLLHIPQITGDSALFVGVLLMTIYAITDFFVEISNTRKAFSGQPLTALKGDDAL